MNSAQEYGKKHKKYQNSLLYLIFSAPPKQLCRHNTLHSEMLFLQSTPILYSNYMRHALKSFPLHVSFRQRKSSSEAKPLLRRSFLHQIKFNMDNKISV